MEQRRVRPEASRHLYQRAPLVVVLRTLALVRACGRRRQCVHRRAAYVERHAVGERTGLAVRAEVDPTARVRHHAAASGEGRVGHVELLAGSDVDRKRVSPQVDRHRRRAAMDESVGVARNFRIRRQAQIAEPGVPRHAVVVRAPDLAARQHEFHRVLVAVAVEVQHRTFLNRHLAATRAVEVVVVAAGTVEFAILHNRAADVELIALRRDERPVAAFDELDVADDGNALVLALFARRNVHMQFAQHGTGGGIRHGARRESAAAAVRVEPVADRVVQAHRAVRGATRGNEIARDCAVLGEREIVEAHFRTVACVPDASVLVEIEYVGRAAARRRRRRTKRGVVERAAGDSGRGTCL